jgi:Lar family restriction alleviation protein
MPDATHNLLPCPFCGSADVSFRAETWCIYVICDNCEAEGPGFGGQEADSMDEAAAAWNQRNPWQPIETAPADAVEILVLEGRNVKSVVSSGPDAGCFSNEFGDEESLAWFPTHWQPLYLPPITP